LEQAMEIERHSGVAPGIGIGEVDD
jgi:hypothetical protein